MGHLQPIWCILQTKMTRANQIVRLQHHFREARCTGTELSKVPKRFISVNLWKMFKIYF